MDQDARASGYQDRGFPAFQFGFNDAFCLGHIVRVKYLYTVYTCRDRELFYAGFVGVFPAQCHTCARVLLVPCHDSGPVVEYNDREIAPVVSYVQKPGYTGMEKGRIPDHPDNRFVQAAF